MISERKRKALKSLPNLFARNAERGGAAKDAELKDLHANTGKLTAEGEHLSKAAGC